MRKTLTILAIMVLVTVAFAACQTTVVEREVMPEPRNGTEYTITELCEHVTDAGYDVSGSIRYTIPAETFESGVSKLPRLAQVPVRRYIGDGLATRLTFHQLCSTVV